MRRPKNPEVKYSSPRWSHVELKRANDSHQVPLSPGKGSLLHCKQVVQSGAALSFDSCSLDTNGWLGSSSFLGLLGLGREVTTCSVHLGRQACGPAGVTFPDVWKNPTGLSDVTRDKVWTGSWWHLGPCFQLSPGHMCLLTFLKAEYLRQRPQVHGSKLADVGSLSLVTPRTKVYWVSTYYTDRGLVQKTCQVDKKYMLSLSFFFMLHRHKTHAFFRHGNRAGQLQ